MIGPKSQRNNNDLQTDLMQAFNSLNFKSVLSNVVENVLTTKLTTLESNLVDVIGRTDSNDKKTK